MAIVSGPGYTGLSNTGENEVSGFGQQLADSISSTQLPIDPNNPAFVPIYGYGLTVLAPAQTAGATALHQGQPAFQVLASTNQSNGSSRVSGSVTVYGSGGFAQMGLDDNTPLSFNSEGGSGAIVTGDGNNLLGSPIIAFTGPANFSVRTGAGNDTITFVAGTNTINAGTGNNLILTGVTGGTASDLVGVTGNDTVLGAGSGTDTVALSGGTAYVAEGTKNLLFIANATTGGSAAIFGGSGSDSLALGFGGGSVFGGAAGQNVLAGGTGQAASYLQGGGTGDMLFAKAGPTTLVAGSGNETLVGIGAAGSTTYTVANGGTDLVFGGAGNELFNVGTSAEPNFAGLFNITTGTGADTVTFGPYGSHATSSAFVVITDFNPSTDKLSGLASQSAGVIGGAAAGSIITLTDGTKLQFTSAPTLTGSNFV